MRRNSKPTRCKFTILTLSPPRGLPLTSNLVPRASFPLTSGRKTRALGAILVPTGRAPFGQHQESRPLAVSNNGSPRFTDFPSLCACSESSLTNLIGSGLNLLCLQIHSKPECRWTWPEVAILGADQKERGLWERECLGATISGMRHRCRCAVSRITRIRLFPLLFQNGCSQSSRFLPQARRIVGSGDENV